MAAASLESDQRQQPARSFSAHQHPLPPSFLRLRTHTRSTRVRMHMPSRFHPLLPPPWGGGLSSTDVALINWAQHSEVGLETTWQFPAASSSLPLPPPVVPPPPSQTPPSLPPSSSLDHVSQQVGCWEVRLPCGVDIPPASSSPGALHCRHSLWQGSLGSGLSAGAAERLTDSMGAHTGTHTHTHILLSTAQQSTSQGKRGRKGAKE